ncbi:TRAP transporter small permease [Defluviimonas sp. WL0002]|uniref:TRAP transporter small permease protein n=1 Tax=Albidovulum marisflavi TaxID=2984159 RepID=A0ABT2ZEM8_9RHOB|nr:TRAP transporter small permease [Defluviimonas sp. WL0002]MCV2869603.1 TRAP transporter small permease [Defluviimonas sp. WL0002]
MRQGTIKPPSWVRAISLVSNMFGVIAATMIMASVLITCQMIFVRGVLGQSTIWQTEAVIYLMIAATLIGLPYVQHQRGHVGVDLIPGLLPPSMRRLLAFAVLFLTLLMVGVMTFYGWEMFHLAWSRNWKSETVWAVPLWIPYLSVPLGFGVFALQLASDLWLAAKSDGAQLETTVHGISPDGENL